MSHEQICHIFPLGVVLYGHVKIKYQKQFLKHSKLHICLPDALETAPSYFVKIPYPFQCSLYSMYKRHVTYKELFGIGPSGAISFISELYAGSICSKRNCYKNFYFEQKYLGRLLLNFGKLWIHN